MRYLHHERGEDEGNEEEEDKRCQESQRFAEVNVKVEGDEGRNDCDGVVVVVERHRLGESGWSWGPSFITS